nr:DUF6676 family protein [Corynebacterium lactis]
MANEITPETMPIDKAVEILRHDDVIASNPTLQSSLEAAIHSNVATTKSDINLINFDTDPVGVDTFSYAREIVDKLGGTAIVRTPTNITVASEDFPRAAIAQGELHYFGFPQDPAAGLNALLNDLAGYAVPWTIYSVVIAAIIIGAFIALTFYWLRKAR